MHDLEERAERHDRAVEDERVGTVERDDDVEPFRTLFEVVHGKDGPVPAVPLVAPGRAAYDARDLVVDTAAAWVVEVWDAAALGRSRVPGRVEGHDGYGTSVPLTLEP